MRWQSVRQQILEGAGDSMDWTLSMIKWETIGADEQLIFSHDLKTKLSQMVSGRTEIRRW